MEKPESFNRTYMLRSVPENRIDRNDHVWTLGFNQSEDPVGFYGLLFGKGISQLLHFPIQQLCLIDKATIRYIGKNKRAISVPYCWVEKEFDSPYKAMEYLKHIDSSELLQANYAMVVSDQPESIGGDYSVLRVNKSCTGKVGLKSVIIGDVESKLEGGTRSVVLGEDWSKLRGGHRSLLSAGGCAELRGKQDCVLVADIASYLESDVGSVMIGTYDCEYNVTPNSVIAYRDEMGKMQCMTTDQFTSCWLKGIQTIIDLVN